MGLVLRESKVAPKWADAILAVYDLGAGVEGARADVTARVKAGASLPEGRYVVATIQRAGDSPWHGNRCYVNLLTPGVTEKFIEVTLEAYRREIGAQFGKRVPGVFTDEPNIRPAGGLPWAEDLPEQFERRWGYRLLEHLPSLVLEVGDWRRVRHNYFFLLNELFIARWAKPMYDWCDRNGLEFTGHYWDHEWPHCVGVPDNMAMAGWQHRPGIDTLMNQYAEHTYAQFGNVRFCREISSVANQLGRARTLCEAYGAGGWDLRFEDMKRIGDWLLVLGINTLDEHLSYITLRGARKRDHPQSFSYHEPWWEAYHQVATYLTRLSVATSQGQQIHRVLVLEPTSVAWMYQGNEAKLKPLGSWFFDLLMALEAAQVEYDLGCEEIIARVGEVTGKELRVGQRRYATVVLPPLTENLNARTAELLAAYTRAGGVVLACDEPPSRVDGRLDDRVRQAARAAGWRRVGAADLPGQLRPVIARDGFEIVRDAGDSGKLFHHRRELADGQLLFLVNSSLDHASAGEVLTPLAGLERWDPQTGQVTPYAFTRAEGLTRGRFELPPSGSLLLFLSRKSRPAAAVAWGEPRPIPASGALETQRLEPNVLVLDYVDVTAGGETRKDVYFYRANQFAWQKNGVARNPWDSAVQFKDELIAKTFPPESGFSASYRFTIQGPVPATLALVLERADLYTITCNGQPVRIRPGSWWLDQAFAKLDIAALARTGENVVAVKAAPFTIWHELEPAYVLGEFTVRPTERGFAIAADAPLTLGSAAAVVSHGINPDGTMWLSGGIGFEQDGQGKAIADRSPFVVFDLGRVTELSGIRIWNYNENHVRDLTARGARSLRISGATDLGAAPYPVQLGTFDLAQGSGQEAPAELLRVSAAGVRYVRFDILENYHGVKFPASGEPLDHGFVGLAEVQFLGAGNQLVPGVSLQSVSGELATHQRQAQHLLNGSGLGESVSGWNRQGHPFYAAGVAYRQEFRVNDLNGKFTVKLGRWLGSVARVSVTGDLGAYISAPPWECEVTDDLRRGENRVEVVVIGTLKNTLGPHHAGSGLGSAWPGMFQRGPEAGPPPGLSYHTVGYGLFEPFTLQQALRK